MCEMNILAAKIAELKEWEELLEQAESMVETLKDFIKQEMKERDTEELEVGCYIARFTTVLSNRFDTTTFKREHADLYKLFTKQVTSKRFSVK